MCQSLLQPNKAVEVGRKRKFGEHQDEDQDQDGDGDTETIGSDGEGPTAIIALGSVNSRVRRPSPLGL